MSEADIHFEFYRHLANAISDKPQRNGITFGDVRPEYGQDTDGFADIVIMDDDGDPVMVVEAKAPNGSGRSRTDIDPYAPKVIRQAFRYAGDLGAPYFSTFNGSRLVVFDAYDEGVPLLQRSTKSYEISDLSAFADTFLDEISRIRVGDAKWDADDDVFVERLKSLHEKVHPDLEDELTDLLESDDEFQSRFYRWTEAQGIEYEDADSDEKGKIRNEFSIQASYLLINKILFYKILESSPTYADELEPLAVSPFRVKEDLEEYFDHIVEEIDFEAIFEHDEIYSEIPLDSVSTRIRDFVIELDDLNLTQFDSDVVGRIYEGVIPPDRRHEMGEYYTPPAICDFITQLTIEDGNDEVIDPACGSGGFLISAYHRKKKLLPESEGGHDHILSQVHGIDINRFPAHLSAINLSIQDLTSHTDSVNVEVSDFFDVNPDTLRFGRVVAGAEGSTWVSGDVEDSLGGFDVVIGNPPYIRQENISDKEKVRQHLSSNEIDADYLSKRSDIFTYFITHATEFLTEGGRLGYIVSDRWLDTKYGEDVQEFLLSNYNINAIVKFDRQVFDDALVDSSLIILEKESDEDKREDNVTKFLRVKQETEISDLVGIIEDDMEPDKMISTDEYRLVTRTQTGLHAENKWNVFFFAPPFYFEFISQPGIVQLSDVADVSYGLKTGANPFFTANTEEWVELGLESYVTPLLKATGQVDKIVFPESESDEWAILDVHDLVEEALDEMGVEFGEQDEDRVLEWLSENGHEELVEYIYSGKTEEYHTRSSLQSRDVWFDLGELTPPPMLHTQFTWREHRVVWNEAEAIATNQFHCIRAEGRSKLLCALLNTRVIWLVKELTSRRTGGQGMTRLQTMVYETKQLPIPDPSAISEEDRERIESAFDDLIEKEKSLQDPEPGDKEEERDALDSVVLEVLGLEDSLDELKHAVESMVASREMAAGQHTSVLVERLREKAEDEAIDLPGVESAREGTTLEDFS